LIPFPQREVRIVQESSTSKTEDYIDKRA